MCNVFFFNSQEGTTADKKIKKIDLGEEGKEIFLLFINALKIKNKASLYIFTVTPKVAEKY